MHLLSELNFQQKLCRKLLNFWIIEMICIEFSATKLMRPKETRSNESQQKLSRSLTRHKSTQQK